MDSKINESNKTEEFYKMYDFELFNRLIIAFDRHLWTP